MRCRQGTYKRDVKSHLNYLFPYFLSPFVALFCYHSLTFPLLLLYSCAVSYLITLFHLYPWLAILFANVR